MKRILFVFVVVLFSVNTFSQIQNNLLKVQGKANLYDVPELMVVNMTINTQDAQYAKCAEKLVFDYSQIEKAFLKKGIPTTKLKSNNMDISETYSWSPDRERTKNGYRGFLSFVLELPYDKKTLNTVMQTLNEQGTVNFHLSFKLSNEQKDKLLQKSIELAIEDAKTKAKHIANALNVNLGEIREINFEYVNYEEDMLRFETNMSDMIISEDAMVETKEPSLNLTPQTLEINKSLGIVWTIKQ